MRKVKRVISQAYLVYKCLWLKTYRFERRKNTLDIRDEAMQLRMKKHQMIKTD